MNAHYFFKLITLPALLVSCGGGGNGGNSSPDIPDVTNPSSTIAAPTEMAGVYQCAYGTDSSFVYMPGNGHIAVNGKAIITFNSPNDPIATIGDTITWACQEHTGDIYGRYNTDHIADILNNFSYHTVANKAYLEINYDSSGSYILGIQAAPGGPPTATTPVAFNFIYSYTFTFQRKVDKGDGSFYYEGNYTCQVIAKQLLPVLPGDPSAPMFSEGTFRFDPAN